MHSHAYSFCIWNPSKTKLQAAFTARCFVAEPTSAPVLTILHVARLPSARLLANIRVSDILFEHMRLAAAACIPPSCNTYHILAQSVGCTYVPAPKVDDTNPGAIFWTRRMAITDQGLDFICQLGAGCILYEDCVAVPVIRRAL